MRPSLSSLTPALLPALILSGLMLGGCSDQRTVAVKVHGVTPMNLNTEKESTPVNVRVYALTDDSTFRAATVDQLWSDAGKVLGDKVVGEPVTFTVFPGNAGDPPVRQELTISKRAAFLGILALYQGADAQDRRTLVLPLREAGRQVLTFSGYAVSVADAGKEP